MNYILMTIYKNGAAETETIPDCTLARKLIKVYANRPTWRASYIFNSRGQIIYQTHTIAP